MQLPFDLPTEYQENPEYLTQQLITYLGNKRSLSNDIERVVFSVREKLGGKKLKSCDAFSGSGVVSRVLKKHSEHIIANDLEAYAACISRTYLTNHEDVDWDLLTKRIEFLRLVVEKGGGPKGFIADLYAPSDDNDIKHGERVFYTSENARRLDAWAQLIRQEPEEIQDLLLAPLLSEASIHANTGGVFKGFYKSKETGLGTFGGSGRDALSRITAPIELNLPILSNCNSQSTVHQVDVALLPELIGECDLVYLDPPYNQHPYGSNYFMLNLLTEYKRPLEVSSVSGIPTDWNRSPYNKKQQAFNALKDLVARLDSKFILLSFSDDGFLDPQELRELFESMGRCEVFNKDYRTYRASRNLSGRSLTITEHLFLVEKN
jgi:adenine-specific DNA-methyltransferase